MPFHASLTADLAGVTNGDHHFLFVFSSRRVKKICVRNRRVAKILYVLSNPAAWITEIKTIMRGEKSHTNYWRLKLDNLMFG